jgi:hypothetical protein
MPNSLNVPRSLSINPLCCYRLQGLRYNTFLVLGCYRGCCLNWLSCCSEGTEEWKGVEVEQFNEVEHLLLQAK